MKNKRELTIHLDGEHLITWRGWKAALMWWVVWPIIIVKACFGHYEKITWWLKRGEQR